MGCRIATAFLPILVRLSDTALVVCDFPQPVRTAQTETTGLEELIIVSVGDGRMKLAPWAIAMDPTRITWLWGTSEYEKTTSTWFPAFISFSIRRGSSDSFTIGMPRG